MNAAQQREMIPEKNYLEGQCQPVRAEMALSACVRVRDRTLTQDSTLVLTLTFARHPRACNGWSS
jgi:hypothetical protein